MTITRLRLSLLGLLLLPYAAAFAVDSSGYIDRSVSLIEESKYSLARTYLNPAIIDYRLSGGIRSRAYYLRGYSYFAQGSFVSAAKDYHRALEFNPDNPGALAALGDLYFRGRGVDLDQSLAFNLFQKAAASGHPGAMLQVGFAYLEGAGVEKDLVQARKWLTDSADGGNIAAMAYLARSYRKPYTDEPEPEIARSWYKKAEAAGSREALVALAYMHQKGELGEADAIRAAELFAQAAQAGSSSAKVSLAHQYLTGTGVTANIATARALFEEAAAADNPAAYLSLGHLYEAGVGVPESLETAKGWYRKAAELDVVPAQMRLVYLSLAEDDVAGALPWLARAAALDTMTAHNDYAWLLATTPEDELRNGELALVHAEQAVALEASPAYLDTLAAAFAELGRFPEAIEAQQRAMSDADPEDAELIAELEEHLGFYQQGKPWRD
jgi:TPR repeat protein